MTDHLTPDTAIDTLSALAHPGRLAVFRTLVAAGADGLAAGVVAQRVGSPANTLSTQLAILSRAGLIRSRRDGRSIVYRADYDGVAALLSYLVQDCCGGRPEVCARLTAVVDGARSCTDAGALT